MAARRLYFDNAATSFPKPHRVHDAMFRYATEVGASPGRGAYAEAREGGRLITLCRQRINTLINGQDPDHVVFTLNATDALNLAIKGIVANRRVAGPHQHVHLVTTAMEHNSVLRPFNALIEHDPAIEWTCVTGDPVTGLVDPADIARVLRPDTALVAVIHASNVTGTLQPVAEIGRLCRERSVPLLVDAAQSLGHVPIDVQDMNIDLLAFPGHKGLLGPLGTGGLYLKPGLEQHVLPLREGGTGTVSESDIHPEAMPQRYEPGSHNTVGIVGLCEGVGWILDRGIETVHAHEQRLIATMLDGLRDLPLRLIGPQGTDHRVGVFSVAHESIPPSELADLLEQQHGVLVRPGLHCAPRAHALMGTLPDTGQVGTVRFSFGPFLTEDDVAYTCSALRDICQPHAVVG